MYVQHRPITQGLLGLRPLRNFPQLYGITKGPYLLSYINVTVQLNMQLYQKKLTSNFKFRFCLFTKLSTTLSIVLTLLVSTSMVLASNFGTARLF